METETKPQRGGYRPRREVTEGAIPLSDALSMDDAKSVHNTNGDGDTLESEIERIRKVRKPFGSLSQKLALPKRPGYHRHWFNDTAGRIDEAKASGWEHIKGETGQSIKRVVGSGRDNGALYAFAMELPEVFWEEDQDALHKAAQDKIDQIKESPFRSRPGEAKAADKGKFYSPQEDSGPLQIEKR